MRRLLCWMGFHGWRYFGTRRHCWCCQRTEVLRYAEFGEEWFEWGP